MKHYRYSTQVLWLSIIFPVVLMIGLFIWAVLGVITNGPLGIYQLILVAMPLLLISSLIGLNNPSSITLTPDSIIFEGFWRKHEYKWIDVDELTLKDYGYVGKAFIRIGKYHLLGGRYWVSSNLEGYKELLEVIESKLEGCGIRERCDSVQSK
ncbi:Uncharacterised protein [Mycobacteroides abscessus subsp. abscessus]|nr:Uncharacterised protein [Mycobacteroides abscessus subsp. abscessus]